MKRGQLTGKWEANKQHVSVNLPVMFFEDNGVNIAYIPVLDISGYGNTEQEAQESLTVALNDYFSYTISKKTLLQDLKNHGWKISKKQKPYIAPEVTDVIEKNEYLHNIVNNKPYTMQRMDVNIPQFA